MWVQPARSQIDGSVSDVEEFRVAVQVILRDSDSAVEFHEFNGGADTIFLAPLPYVLFEQNTIVGVSNWRLFNFQQVVHLISERVNCGVRF